MSRTISQHGSRCLGVYADIANGGNIHVGDSVSFEPPEETSAVAASVGRLAERIRGNTIRLGNRALPKDVRDLHVARRWYRSHPPRTEIVENVLLALG